jgi:Domain of unknown function (DUF4440)
LQSFFGAVDALNRQDMDGVQKLLHEEIVLNKIHDQLGTVRGKEKVHEFLRAKVEKDKPLLKPISPISVDTRTGTVSGLAMWEDHEASGNINELIDYSFTFVRGENGWRINNMYASLR